MALNNVIDPSKWDASLSGFYDNFNSPFENLAAAQKLNSLTELFSAGEYLATDYASPNSYIYGKFYFHLKEPSAITQIRVRADQFETYGLFEAILIREDGSLTRMTYGNAYVVGDIAGPDWGSGPEGTIATIAAISIVGYIHDLTFNIPGGETLPRVVGITFDGWGGYPQGSVRRLLALETDPYTGVVGPTARRNQLFKRKKRTFVPGSAGQPAYAGQPYLPARCVQVSESYQTATYTPVSYTYTPISQFSSGAFRLPPNSYPVYGTVKDSGSISVNTTGIVGVMTRTGGEMSGYTTVTQTRTVCYPEQPYIAPRAEIPAVPSQTIVDLQLGWNSGARSVASMRGSGRIEFMSPKQTTGAVVGLNQTDTDAGFATIDKAWYLSGGIARIYEDGVEKMYVGPYETDDLFVIERMFGVVTYKLNGTTVYTSETMLTDPVFMDVSLYTADDGIYNPAIYDYGIASGNKLQPLYSSGSGTNMKPASGANVAMPTLRSAGGRSATTYGQGANIVLPYLTMSTDNRYKPKTVVVSSLQPLTATSRVAVRASGNLPLFDTLGSDHTYGEGAYAMPLLRVEGQGGMPMPAYARAEVGMIPLSGGGAGTTGEIGGSVAAMGVLDSLSSDHAYGEISVTLQPLSSCGFAYEGNNAASIWSPLVVYNHWYVPFQTFVVWNEDMTVATLISASKLVNAEMGEEVTVAASMTTSELLTAIMNSFVQAGFSVPVFNPANNVWVVSEAGQSSRYEGYEFNSFGKIGARYYGMKADGLYLLEGEDDDGTPIKASVGLGMHDFGTSALKRIANCYIGVASSGTMFLKVIANGEEYLYAARSDDPYMATQRVDIGKGIRANYMTFELYNSNGCDFELNSVEFAAVALNRRI